jgi:hypothetical protein
MVEIRRLSTNLLGFLIWPLHDENLKFEHPKITTIPRQTNFQLTKKKYYNSSNCVTLN